MLRIRQERLRRGWTLRELAFRSAIDPSTLSRLERGLLHPYPAWRRRLAVILKLPADRLFSQAANDEVT
jgi:transcriptional regulator with XRE-family HTH domain